jgi:hypothetical protein
MRNLRSANRKLIKQTTLNINKLHKKSDYSNYIDFSRNYNRQYIELLKEYYSYTNLYSFKKRYFTYKSISYKNNLLQYLKRDIHKNKIKKK